MKEGQKVPKKEKLDGIPYTKDRNYTSCLLIFTVMEAQL